MTKWSTASAVLLEGHAQRADPPMSAALTPGADNAMQTEDCEFGRGFRGSRNLVCFHVLGGDLQLYGMASNGIRGIPAANRLTMWPHR